MSLGKEFIKKKVPRKDKTIIAISSQTIIAISKIKETRENWGYAFLDAGFKISWFAGAIAKSSHTSK